MQHLEVSGAVRPLQWSLGVKGLSTKNHRDTKRLHIVRIILLCLLFLTCYYPTHTLIIAQISSL